jgi:transcriptional regulator with XRE-family HTH domain
MAEKYKFPQFQDLLWTAIGPNRTQAEFATETGITKEHLNRMLNQSEIHRPSITTLTKIAGHAYGGITLNELKVSCGYDVEESDEKKSAENPVDRAYKSARTLVNGFQEMASKNTIYEDLYGFIDIVNMLYAEESFSYKIGDECECNSDQKAAAENCAIVTVTWNAVGYTGWTDILVYYCVTQKGSVIVTDVSAEEKDLMQHFSNMFSPLPNDKFYDWHLHHVEGLNFVLKTKKENSKAADLATNKKFLARVRDIMKDKNISEKEAIVVALFGDPDRPTRISTVEGVGFCIDDVPEYVIINFLHNHKDTFCKTEKESEMFEKLTTGTPMSEVFTSYSTEARCAGDDHWGVAAVNIMYRETGIRFELWEDSHHMYPYENRSLIMFSQSMPYHLNDAEKELSHDSLIQILDRYARELRSEVEDGCYFMMDFDA